MYERSKVSEVQENRDDDFESWCCPRNPRWQPTWRQLLWKMSRVKSGKFGQPAKFGQRPCLFHILIIGIKIDKLSK